MIALILSIVFSAFLVICFKLFERFHINTFQAIVFNYITCVITGSLMYALPDLTIIQKPWFFFALFLGCSYFCTFNLMGYVARNSGVTVTSVASKLSMVIPVIAAVILYHDALTINKVAAVALGLTAVVLVSIKQDSIYHRKKTLGIALAVIIFFTSGINDSLINFTTIRLLQPEEFQPFVTAIFLCASICGVIALIAQVIIKKQKVEVKNIAGGIVLGIPNYLSLICLIAAIRNAGWSSSVIFPINNMGIVILTAATAYFLFKEKFSSKNILGLSMALIAIALLVIS